MTKVNMNKVEEFKSECLANVTDYSKDESWQLASKKWLSRAFDQKFMYNFTALGRPIIQLPNDIVAIQELIWEVKPDLIIETGIAHGGSLILSASMLALLDVCEAIENGTILDPKNSDRKVLGIDIDIREHNKEAIENHPMFNYIQMIEGSSVDQKIIRQVQNFSQDYNRIMVCLDSNHTHEHVLAELEAYAPLTSTGSYCVVFDTIVEDMPEKTFPNRPWAPNNSPKSAVREYLKNHSEFEVDTIIDDKLMISVAPNGYLKKIC